MQFKAYKTEIESNLPPNLEGGTILPKVTKVVDAPFKLNGNDTKGMRVFVTLADGTEKEYRTSSGVLMEQFKKFFEAHPNEPLENVKVVAPRGKNYLTLEEA